MKKSMMHSAAAFMLGAMVFTSSMSFADTAPITTSLELTSAVMTPVTVTSGVETSDSVDMALVMDTVKLSDYTDCKVIYNGEAVSDSLKIVKVGGVTMVPLASSLRALGYDVKWVEETQRVEISKGAVWTSIKIGENAYFKNRMAPISLTSAPVIIEGSTYVPAEFLAEIMNVGIQVNEGQLILSDFEATIHSGYVKEVSMDETGGVTITLTKNAGSDAMEDLMIIHTSKAFTYYNTSLEEGKYVHMVSPMFMTMSLPAQTSAYIVYCIN